MSEEEENINNGLKMTDDSEEKFKVDSQQSLAEPEALNSKSEIKTMEVHHHPQVEKKSFKEYLLEGVMIFIAVTMGFFAENIREHFADKKSEKLIISALKKDLVKDTILLHDLIDNYIPTYHSWIDSSHLNVDSLSLKGNERKFCKAFFNATFWKIYTPPAIALTLLKNPSTFNLIEDETVKKEILNYNVTIDHYTKYSEFLTNLQHYIDTSFVSIVSRYTSRALLDSLNIRENFLNNNNLPKTILFKTNDKTILKNYVNKLDPIDFKIHDIGGFYQDILNQDIKLLKLFNEKYHLENE